MNANKQLPDRTNPISMGEIRATGKKTDIRTKEKEGTAVGVV